MIRITIIFSIGLLVVITNISGFPVEVAKDNVRPGLGNILEEVAEGFAELVKAIVEPIAKKIEFCLEQTGLNEIDMRMLMNMTEEQRVLNPKYQELNACYHETTNSTNSEDSSTSAITTDASIE